MREIDDVLSNYIATKLSTPLVPGKNTTLALTALRHEIPTLLKEIVTTSGYGINEFHIHASAGEPNRSFAKVPWAAIFKKSITKSARKGYYIVLLFSEDMSSVSLSLNQGYTAFQERYVYSKLAYQKLRECATAATSILTRPTGFSVGPIDLHTDGELAKGYEAGSIFSKTYVTGATPSHIELEKDVHDLLHAYMALSSNSSESLINLNVDVSASDFVDAIENTVRLAPEVPSSSGPQPPPPMGASKGGFKYARSTDVSSRALAMSKFSCTLGTLTVPHESFKSAKTRRNYVEIHHLVPFSQQVNFLHSLDVEENLVALCPNCHRMLHHGASDQNVAPLKSLLLKREEALSARGISVTFDELKKMYKILTEDD